MSTHSHVRYQKIQRNEVLALLLLMYKLSFKYAPLSLTEDEAKQLKKVKTVLEQERML